MSKHGRDDVETDPRLDDGSQADWSSEGGALPEGPATESEAGDDPAPTSEADSDVPEDR